MNKKFSTKNLVMLGLFIALEIIASRFLAVEFINKKYSFTFIVTATMGALFGPWFSVIAGIVADVVGNMLFGKYGFFPGFTLTAAVTGFIYGYCLHKDEITLKDIVLSVVLVSLIPNAILNTLWVSIMTHVPFTVSFVTRIPALIINFALKLVVLPILLPRVVRPCRRELTRIGVQI